MSKAARAKADVTPKPELAKADVTPDESVTHAPTGDGQPIELPETNEEVKPVTLVGKPVPMSVGNKVRLINTKNNRIITGFIDHKLATEQTKLFSHIKIVNEATHGKG